MLQDLEIIDEEIEDVEEEFEAARIMWSQVYHVGFSAPTVYNIFLFKSTQLNFSLEGLHTPMTLAKLMPLQIVVGIIDIVIRY